jgi:magnesium transporter
MIRETTSSYLVDRRLLKQEEWQTSSDPLGYEEGTAERYMSPDFVELCRDMSVGQAMERIRRQALQKETIYYAYVIDDERHLLGVVSLRELVISATDAKVADIMTQAPKFVYTDTDREEVARVLSDYALLAIPVVDREARLVGIITWHEAMDILQAETTEDIHKMAGVGVKEHARSPLFESAKRRIPWLAFNMAWAFAGAAIISLFEGTIDKVAALAVFMPLISGQAGNAGIQTATITIRSIALGELEWHNVLQALTKEWGLGAIKGVIFGSVIGIIAWIWKHNGFLGLVAGVSLFANMFVAATAGVVLPMTLRKLKMDPAAIAGVFDTMLTDFMGFLIYLGLATLLITKLLPRGG